VWEGLYDTASRQGDIVKFVGTAKGLEDNLKLESFRNAHSLKPMIAINMGYEGQLSRVLNTFLTPVTHPSLPIKAAPGQLSLKQINEARYTIGTLKPKEFFVTGSPISQSPSQHSITLCTKHSECLTTMLDLRLTTLKLFQTESRSWVPISGALR
jgi:pentafunctional AROM polypeptide